MDGSEKFNADFMKVAKTTLSSIILSQDKEHFAKLAGDAVMRLKGSTNLESIQITKKPGVSLIDSFLDEGFIGEELLKNKELLKTEELQYTANSGGYYGFCKDEGKSDGKREKRKKSELADEFVQAQKIRAKLFGVNPRRSFTLKEFTEYNEKINMSGGFDIGDAPLDIDFQLMYLRPVQLSPDGLWTLNEVEDFSKLALDKYNEDLQRKYKFVKFLKANYSSSIQALELYLTFEAKDTTKDVPVKTFQAHISRLFGGNAEVKFCRTA